MPLHKAINFFIHDSNKLKPLSYSRTRNIVFCNLLTLIVLPILSFVFYRFEYTNNAIALLLFEICLAIPLFITKYTNRINLAANILIIIIFFVFNWLMLNESKLLSPLGYWLAFIPILATLLINIRAGYFWLILSILTVIAYFIYQKYWKIPIFPIYTTLSLRTLSICLLSLFLFSLIYIFETKKNETTLILQQLLKQTIKKRKEIENTLKHLAHHDQLTGLPNKIFYFELLNKHITAAKENRSKIFLLYLDLDNFKDINNMAGHYVADRFLKEISDQFAHIIDKKDILCRIGGDEFMFILNHIQNVSEATTIVKKLLQTSIKSIAIDNYYITSGASIGIAIYPDHGNNHITLTENADIAMHHAKASGKGTFKFYDEELNQQTKKQLIMENYLRDAINNHEFHIAYQPQYDSNNKNIVSIEALIRWNNPLLGMIDPEVFIPIAEKMGIIISIGEWVLKEACKQFKQWQQSDLVPSSTKIAVNLSILQMEQSSFFSQMNNIFKETKLDPKYLEIELTESTINRSHESMLTLFNNFESLGVSIAMDDFGTGYSSFNRLINYPLNVIKMDKSFLFSMAENNQNIIHSMISLAHSLDLKVVAEGVESEEQYLFLKMSGCDYIQGFYLCPPLNAANMTEHLTALKNQQK